MAFCELLVHRKDILVEIRLKNAAILCNSYGVDVAILQSFTYVAKMLTGSHRPMFFEVCKPDAMENCIPGTFISEFECTNTEATTRELQEASQSFFSSHAAFFVYSSTFLAFYFQKRFKPRHPFVIPFCQMIILLVGFYGAVSRILDHHHHSTDVVAGVIFGILTTIHAVSCKINQLSKFH